ncbi:MAG: hypothetical protein CSYNP_02551 [Syntrophus sp. SKADARSKE-3]|nr:hypothetical protein [Syntrophus sp. SKADARSKE-3]
MNKRESRAIVPPMVFMNTRFPYCHCRILNLVENRLDPTIQQYFINTL